MNLYSRMLKVYFRRTANTEFHVCAVDKKDFNETISLFLSEKYLKIQKKKYLTSQNIVFKQILGSNRHMHNLTVIKHLMKYHANKVIKLI